MIFLISITVYVIFIEFIPKTMYRYFKDLTVLLAFWSAVFPFLCFLLCVCVWGGRSADVCYLWTMQIKNTIEWKYSYPIKHGGPAFHRNALEDSEHGKKDVVEACYSVIWSDPPFFTHGLIYGTYPRSIRRALRNVPLITRGLTLTLFVDLRWNERVLLFSEIN